MPLTFLFPDDPTAPRAVDPAYAAERDAARAAGGDAALVSYEALVRGDAAAAVARVPDGASRQAVYRGWMLAPAVYDAFHAALAARGVALVNGPAEYRHAHLLPDNYPVIAAHTPRSAWVPAPVDLERAVAAAATLAPGALVIKDYVKSRKHEWREACFVPDAADAAAVRRVAGRFLELQGDDLVGGLVLREFVALEPLGTHAQSDLPLANEHRWFVVDGAVAYATPYWAVECAVAGAPPPAEPFASLAKQVRSRFFSMDLARTAAGGWLVVELGDGQVAGVPEEPEGVRRFYAELVRRLG